MYTFLLNRYQNLWYINFFNQFLGNEVNVVQNVSKPSRKALKFRKELPGFQTYTVAWQQILETVCMLNFSCSTQKLASRTKVRSYHSHLLNWYHEESRSRAIHKMTKERLTILPIQSYLNLYLCASHEIFLMWLKCLNQLWNKCQQTGLITKNCITCMYLEWTNIKFWLPFSKENFL